MKVGIDSYCYHRFFGEVYPHQNAPDKKMTLEDFIKRAKELEVDGVSLESCFVPRFDQAYLSEIKGMLDEFNFDRVYAWGHPDGLELCRMFTNAMKIADNYGIKLADENHIDYNADEMLELIHNVNHPNFGINFDTGNFLRVLDDPIQGMQKLAKFTFATHVKDLKINPQAAVNDWYFFSCTPVGDGLVDNQKLAQLLKDTNFEGFLAMEIDTLHPDYNDDEDGAVAQSVQELKKIAQSLT